MKRREFTTHLALAGIGLGATATMAPAQAQGGPVEGQHFVRLATPAPVTVPADKKIDVVEFFWYGCPHCNALEPLLDRWAPRLPADVSFRKVHVGFGAIHQVHQRMYYALEELGALPTMHKRIFAAMHQQGRRLANEAEIVAFVKESGIDSAKFAETYKSFGVNTKAMRAKQLSEAYKIDGVPSLGIHGRFYTAASLPGNGSHERMLATADALIQRVRQG
jgi:thiol:disulfide interchange protein DsbA